jgi:hypothetical protein
MVTRSKFNTQDSQIRRATVLNLSPQRPGGLCTSEVEWSLFHTYVEICKKFSRKNTNEIMLEFHNVMTIIVVLW